MKTLIEIFDERPIENVLAAEVFKPETVVYLCPAEVAQNKTYQNVISGFLQGRGIGCSCVFLESSLLNASKIEKQLRSIIEKYEDCVIDITGGSDAALFAAGVVCAERSVPVFTYSRKKGRFFNIVGAPFAENLPCTIQYTVKDFFQMAGGSLHQGRVDNAILGKYLGIIDPFFKAYLNNRRNWVSVVNYIQQVSQKSVCLDIEAPYEVKCSRGKTVRADEKALRSLQDAGLISGLKIQKGERVSFSFCDEQIRTWLRDTGAVLELYTYKQCLDCGVFNDVVTSAVVDWGGNSSDCVMNEIDVIAVRGTVPLFISCKVCEADTDALNELSILRSRFGGNGAGAMLITTKTCRNITKNRSAKLGITIVDIDDIIFNRLQGILRGE